MFNGIDGENQCDECVGVTAYAFCRIGVGVGERLSVEVDALTLTDSCLYSTIYHRFVGNGKVQYAHAVAAVLHSLIGFGIGVGCAIGLTFPKAGLTGKDGSIGNGGERGPVPYGNIHHAIAAIACGDGKMIITVVAQLLVTHKKIVALTESHNSVGMLFFECFYFEYGDAVTSGGGGESFGVGVSRRASLTVPLYALAFT